MPNGWVAAALAALALALALERWPCLLAATVGDLPGVCARVLDLGACAISPAWARRLCGRTCGWCAPAPDPRLPGPRWQPMARVHARNLTYAHFVKRFKQTSTPVIIEGWLDLHPKVMAVCRIGTALFWLFKMALCSNAYKWGLSRSNWVLFQLKAWNLDRKTL